MKVWIVLTAYDCEGYGPPESVHVTREAAEEWVTANPPAYPLAALEVFECDVEATS